jgi:hypothetical protein
MLVHVGYMTFKLIGIAVNKQISLSAAGAFVLKRGKQIILGFNYRMSPFN